MQLLFGDISEIILSTENIVSDKIQLARHELNRGLRELGFKGSIGETGISNSNALLITLSAKQSESENYTITFNHSETPHIRLNAESEQSLLYAVFDFLEHQGVFFGLDGAINPIDPITHLTVPDDGQSWTGKPLFANRGLQPWPDFLNCITTFNEEDLRAYLEAMLRMRFNTLGIHVYGQSNKWVEPFLSFEYGGVGHASFADTTATDRWGYLPQRTSRYGMSGAQYFDDEIFGSDATRYSAGPWETAERSQALWQTMFSYAEELGINMGIGFELYQLPEEIVKAVPAQARTVLEHKVPTDGGGTLTHSFHRVDPTSRAAKYILEARLAQLLETYPSVSYIQLWEDEFTNWISQSEDIETPVEPFKQAHDFLRRNAPDKRLIIAGWGGVVRNFERFHRELPEEIIFSALSDQFGWDPIHENFGKLGDRERWPIPWMEDDPSMWFPQIHASRFEKDLQLAQDFGCTGMVGIHWRHRIVDPVATYMARRSWDNSYTTEQHYTAYAKTQASGERAEKFGEWLYDTDVNRKLVETWSGNMRDDGHYESQEFSGDYGEVFLFKKYDISDHIFDEQQTSIDTLHAIFADVTEGSLEHERLHYWNGQVGFMSPYLRAWQSGRKLENLLDGLFQKRKNSEPINTDIIYNDAIPLWINVLENTRDAVILFQHTVATRNDLGTLASIHNKFVRIATFRLQASILEFIDELPANAQQALNDATAPDTSNLASLIVPTRPTHLAEGESIQLTAIAPGTAELTSIQLVWREVSKTAWNTEDMQLAGRRTYSINLIMPNNAENGIEYYVKAQFAATPSPLIKTAPINGVYMVTQ